MKYYEGRESAYRKLEALGREDWDNLTDEKWSFGDTALFRALVSIIPQIQTDKNLSPSALDIGCGTGPVARTLALCGFHTIGIDVSGTAVKLAAKRVADLNLPVEYLLADICEWDTERDFDLIVDSHCLHCLVYDDDRARALTNIHRLLKSEGIFFVETMTSDPEMDFGVEFELDRNGILWNRSIDGPKSDAWIQRNNYWCFPNCRISGEQQLSNELKTSGFEILSRTWIRPEKMGEPASYQAVCRRRQ